MLAPATERILERRVGGRTISRRALVDVVSGCPPESSVSSRSYTMGCMSTYTHVARNENGARRKTYLIYNIKIVFQRSSRYRPEIII